MAEKTITFWAAITEDPKGRKESDKAYFLSVAMEDGTTTEVWWAKSAIVNKVDANASAWQQFVVKAWTAKNLGGKNPAASKPGGAPTAPTPQASIPQVIQTSALAEQRSKAAPLASASDVIQATGQAILPSKSGTYNIWEGGKKKEVPNAWKVQQAANEGEISTQTMRVDINDKGVAVTVRAQKAGASWFVDDTVDFIYEVKKKVFILDAIDFYAKAVKKAQREGRRCTEVNPLARIEEGVPILTPDATYEVYKRWIRAQNFAVRECTTKASSRAQWKVLNKDWREPEEKRAEKREVEMVNPKAEITPPAEDATLINEDEIDAAHEIYEAELQKEQEGAKHVETVQIPPKQMEAKPPAEKPAPKQGAPAGESVQAEVMTPGKDTWGDRVEGFKATIFYNQPDDVAIAKQALEDNGRFFLDNIKKIFGEKIFTDNEVQDIFQSLAIHKDPLYLRKLYGVLMAMLNVDKQKPDAKTWKNARIKALEVK